MVVIAERTYRKRFDADIDSGLREWAKETDISVDFTPEMYCGIKGKRISRVPTVEKGLERNGFREARFDYEKALQEASSVGLLKSDEWRSKVSPPESELRGGLKSLMPLRRSYLVQLMTSGEMGSIYAKSSNGGPPVLVAGGQMRTTKNENVGPGVIKMVSTFKPVIRVFDLRRGEYLPALA